MDKRAQILEESFKLFAKHGYGSTTMQQIGDAVGLDKSSIYAHFGSKHDIFIENLNLEHKAYIECVIDRLPQACDIKSMAHIMFLKTMDYFDKVKLLFWKHAYLHFCSGVETEVSAHIAQVMQDVNLRIKIKFEPLFQENDPNKLIKTVLALFFFIQGALDWHMQQDALDHEIINQSIDIFESLLHNSKIFSS